jgi:hypothetical protein
MTEILKLFWVTLPCTFEVIFDVLATDHEDALRRYMCGDADVQDDTPAFVGAARPATLDDVSQVEDSPTVVRLNDGAVVHVTDERALNELGVPDYALDDLVLDSMSLFASEVNNAGAQTQIRFLRQQGVDNSAVAAALIESIARQETQNDDD